MGLPSFFENNMKGTLMDKMAHTLKIGKYNTRRMCSRCGYVFPTDNSVTMADHKRATKHQETYVMDVDEKIVEIVSMLTQKGYAIKSSCQGGWPDYITEVNLEGGKYEQKTKEVKPSAKHKGTPKKLIINFKMNPSSSLKTRKNIPDELIKKYEENYWKWIGIMIETLPNAFYASFYYETNSTTLPRSIIRQPNPRVRNLVISWTSDMSPRALGSDEEFDTMVAYSYKKLKEWAEELPNINDVLHIKDAEE